MKKQDDKKSNIKVKRDRLYSSPNEISKINLLRCYGLLSLRTPATLALNICDGYDQNNISWNFFSLQYEKFSSSKI
jgi:hypothetical protein